MKFPEMATQPELNLLGGVPYGSSLEAKT